MGPVLDVVIPVFAIIGSGFLAGRIGILGEDSSRALNGFVYWVALPALFLGSLSKVELSDIFNGPLLAAYFGGILGTFALALAVALIRFPDRLGATALAATSAIFANTGYMGIPLLELAFGEAGLLPGIITTVVNGVVLMAVATVLLELDRAQGEEGSVGILQTLRDLAVNVCKSPLVVSAVLGILVAASGLELPRSVDTFLGTLGAAAGPAALFAIGLFLVGTRMEGRPEELAWVVGLKLLVQPALTWWLAIHLFPMDPIHTEAVIIQSALPIGSLMFLLAERYGIYTNRSVAVILISTLLSLVTLSLLFVLLDAR